MEQPVEIKENVYWIGSLDPGLVTFDIVIPTKYGTTYNSYLVRGEKIAVIDTVKGYCVDDFISKSKRACQTGGYRLYNYQSYGT